MKFDKIVGFGDSWVWGDELRDPALAHIDTYVGDPRNQAYRESHCFLGRLGQHYGVPVRNFGWPGGSLQSTIWTYLWWIENCAQDVGNSLVLVGLTNAYRRSYYNPLHRSHDDLDPPWNRFVHDQWLKGSPELFSDEWQQLVKLDIGLTQCAAANRLEYQQALWFFHGQHLMAKNITLQFHVVDPPCWIDVSSVIMPHDSLSSYLLEFSDVTAPGHHPNLSGHDLISKKLTDEIDRAIIA